MSTNCFQIVPRPGKLPVYPSKWVLKVKRGPNGSITKYKASLVFRGDRENISTLDTYAPVIDFALVRLVLSIAVQRNYKVGQLDF